MGIGISPIHRNLPFMPLTLPQLERHLFKAADILRSIDDQWDDVIGQLQQLIDELRTGSGGEGAAPADLPEHCAPFLRTVLDVIHPGDKPDPQMLLRLKDVTVELVDLLVQELQGNPDIWKPYKRADQENLNGRLFDYLMRLRPALVDADKAGVLADRLIDQARANHERLMQL